MSDMHLTSLDIWITYQELLLSDIKIWIFNHFHYHRHICYIETYHYLTQTIFLNQLCQFETKFSILNFCSKSFSYFCCLDQFCKQSLIDKTWVFDIRKNSETVRSLTVTSLILVHGQELWLFGCVWSGPLSKIM